MTSFFSVGGLASGLDTGSIINQLMSLERIPITQAQSKQTALRRIDTAWSSIVTNLSAIRTALDKVKTASQYGTHTSVSSSSDAVAVTRTGSPAAGGLSFTVSQLASSYQGVLSGTTALGSADDLVGDGTLRIKHADGADFTEIDTTGKTLAQVASEIQRHADLQVNASVQQAADGTMRLLVASRRSGADGGVVHDLSDAPASLHSQTELFAAADATVTMGTGPGALQISSPTNRLTNLIPGITIDLKQVSTTPVTVQVERDASVTIEQVRELVNTVNTAVSALKSRTSYDATSGTGGALQGDATAIGLRFALSGALSNAVAGLTGSYTSGASVGIEVGRDGLITLNEEKLSTALAADFDGVVKLFSAPADGPAGAGGRGLFTNLNTILKEYEGAAGRIASARQGLTDRIKVYDDQIRRHEDRLALRERLLRQKFAGLESAMAMLQKQGSTLMAAMGQQSNSN